MISDISLLNGICALAVICTAVIMGFVGLRLYKRTGTKNFLNQVTLSIAIFIGWGGITISFFSVLITGSNSPEIYWIVNITAFLPEPLGAFAVINSNWAVFGSPKRKNVVLAIYALFSLIYYIVLFTTFNQAIVCPVMPPGEILNNWILLGSPLYFIFWSIIIIAVFITAGGFIKFGRESAGEIKKRAYYIIIASLCVGLGILLDTVILMNGMANFDFISRILMVPGLLFIYMGFRPVE